MDPFHASKGLTPSPLIFVLDLQKIVLELLLILLTKVQIKVVTFLENYLNIGFYGENVISFNPPNQTLTLNSYVGS